MAEGFDDRKKAAVTEIKAICEKYQVDIVPILVQTANSIEAHITFFDERDKKGDKQDESALLS